MYVMPFPTNLKVDPFPDLSVSLGALEAGDVDVLVTGA